MLAKVAEAEKNLSKAQAALHAEHKEAFQAAHEDDDHADEVFANAAKGMARRRLQKQNSMLAAGGHDHDDAEAALLAKVALADKNLSRAQAALRAEQKCLTCRTQRDLPDSPRG